MPGVDAEDPADRRGSPLPTTNLGRPAYVWLAVSRPQPQPGASHPDDAAGEPRPPVHDGSAAGLGSDQNGDDELPRDLVA